MLTSTSAFLNSNIGWLSAEDPFSNNQNYLNKDHTVSSSEYSSFPHQFSSVPQPPQVEVEKSTAPSLDDPTMVKKITHNANERDRRKKINSIITSLRSLLPEADHPRKMSFPATISQVVKYIPELQQQVEGLSDKKEELLSIISRQGVAMIKESQMKIPHHSSDFTVSNSWLNDTEAAISISSYVAHNSPLSEILLCLENNGYVLLNASSTETFGGRVFYNLHFQVGKAHRLDSDIVTQKLLSIYEKKKQRVISSNMCLLKINRSSLL